LSSSALASFDMCSSGLLKLSMPNTTRPAQVQ
jgi:hypothetical protein